MSSWQHTHSLSKAIVNDKPNNKIRKRGCSSSSSSSLVRRYRFKRAILVPMSNTRTRSPSMATQLAKALPSSVISGKEKEKEKEKDISVSARKLVASLWDVSDLPLSRAKKKDFDAEKMRSRKYFKKKDLSDPSYSPISERIKGFDFEDYYCLGGFDALSSANCKEVGNPGRNRTCGKVKNFLKEARSGISTSKKLLKALNQICLHEQNSSSMPVILALHSELDHVCDQIEQAIQEQSSKQNDMEYLMKHFAEEKAAWRRREREKVREAISHVAEELEVEKKLRKQTERLNQKIAKEMADVRASHLKLSKKLETEKRGKEILEQICDEMAKGIGEDRAKVEELKRESVKVRDEVEKEREMLQFADVLREERVHMKLSEARYEFEEKNAVLEKLRNEIEAFLKHKNENGDLSPQFKKIKDLESCLNKTRWGFEDGAEEGGDDSADSDLHSIELNMDNDNKIYKWSYACEKDGRDDQSKRVSIDSTGSKSFSEKIQWGSICFNRGNMQENSDGFDVLSRSKSMPLLDAGQENLNVIEF